MLAVSEYNTKNYSPNFTARKIAVVKSVSSALADGANSAIEIYSLGKKDKDFVEKLVKSIDMKKLLPSKSNEPNFSVWQNLIEFISDFIGTTKHQKVFLALQNKKPCGILVSICNRTISKLIGIATRLAAVEKRIKNAGRALFTALLDVAASKKHKHIKLEPILNGPTDAVGFYKKMGMSFPDPNASVMSVDRQGIIKSYNKQAEALNYEKVKNSSDENLYIITS